MNQVNTTVISPPCTPYHVESLTIASKGSKHAIGRAVATFDYRPQQADELALTKGMYVDILSKDEEGYVKLIKS
jgi:hypothetical protein